MRILMAICRQKKKRLMKQSAWYVQNVEARDADLDGHLHKTRNRILQKSTC